MDPRTLENRFLDILAKHGVTLAEKALFTVKHLPNGRIISNRADFFGVWDIIAFFRELVFVFQVCSGTTYQDHVRKITDNFPFTSNPIQVIVYFHKEKGRWVYTLHLRTEVGWITAALDDLLDTIPAKSI